MKITQIAGFLGCGKTTLLLKLYRVLQGDKERKFCPGSKSQANGRNFVQNPQQQTIPRKNMNGIKIEDYHITSEPFYVSTGDEISLFESADRLKLPVLLKGPTGCGKTRFLEHMAWKLSRPLVTIACHEDLTASDLVGRYLLKDNQTIWQDGPLSLAVKHGAICYLDEAVEARKDTTVVIHPLTDNRRILPQEKQGLLLESHPDFLIVMSYNPGYQSVMKDLKHSTRQRFLAIDFTYPPPREEQMIIMEEGNVDQKTAEFLVRLGEMVRNLRQHAWKKVSAPGCWFMPAG